jgi:hypothetical protein
VYSTSHSRPILNFLDRFLKTNQISRSIKIRPVGGWLFHANKRTDRRTNGDRQTEIIKLIAAFRKMAKAPNTSKLISVVQKVSIGGELKFFRAVKCDKFRISGVKTMGAAATQFCRFPPVVICKCMIYYYEHKNMKTHNFMDKATLRYNQSFCNKCIIFHKYLVIFS